jgi:hypothetical protein
LGQPLHHRPQHATAPTSFQPSHHLQLPGRVSADAEVEEKRYTKPGFIIRRNIDAILDNEGSIAFKGLSNHLEFDASVPVLYTNKSTTIANYEKCFWQHRPDVIIQNNLIGITRQGALDYGEIFAQFKKRGPHQLGDAP